jgi:competence ComEA-like helix-hairpin-helix protein
VEEKRAAVILLALAAAGLVVRFWGLSDGAPGAVAYHAAGPGESRDSVAARSVRLARPLARGEKIDGARAPAEELARLPRVGPALAARIVEDRETNGPFGSLEGLDRVSGIGPGTLQVLKPHVTFSGRVEPPSVLSPASTAVSAAPAVKVSLNTATETELAQLPGIGPARARAIVADRRANGRYRTLEELGRVPGIGPATLAALRDRATVP